ncbi:MAG: hypothetical protein JW888_10335, partial [Pirellulales bacterium]|nr:hypothetical protein [Pirellulales bacterium]
GAFFLSTALAPGGAARTGIRPRVETPRFLGVNPLDSYHVIYLTDVEHLDESAVDALERYVVGGGGLAVFLGPRCRAGFLNEALWREGKGLLPAPLIGESELFVDRLDKVPDVEVTDHPMFRILGGKDNSFLATINVTRYFAVPDDWKPAADSATRVIARLRDGAPLVVERPLGKGRVVAWLTTAAPLWNNAGANPSFPVLVQEMQAYLSRRAGAAGAISVGAPLELTLDPARYQAKVGFLSPDEEGAETTPSDAVLADGVLRARFTRTDVAGFYEARLLSTAGTVESRRHAVNVDPREGDLARVDGPRLATRLSGVEYTYYRANAFEVDEREPAGYNLSDGLLYLLVVLLVGEQLFAWSCSYHPPRNGGTAIGRGGAS